MIAFLRKAAILVARVVTVGRYEPRRPASRDVEFDLPHIQGVSIGKGNRDDDAARRT
jgi:hypothetical protein